MTSQVDGQSAPTTPLAAPPTFAIPPREPACAAMPRPEVSLHPDLVDTILSNASEGSPPISHRDLLFAARFLEVERASSLSLRDLIAAIRDALHNGMGPQRLESDLRSLIRALELAGRPTAANGLLRTLRLPS